MVVIVIIIMCYIWLYDKHAIVLDDVNHVVNNLKCLNQALGTGVKSKMKIKIK